MVNEFQRQGLNQFCIVLYVFSFVLYSNSEVTWSAAPGVGREKRLIPDRNQHGEVWGLKPIRGYGIFDAS